MGCSQSSPNLLQDVAEEPYKKISPGGSPSKQVKYGHQIIIHNIDEFQQQLKNLSQYINIIIKNEEEIDEYINQIPEKKEQYKFNLLQFIMSLKQSKQLTLINKKVDDDIVVSISSGLKRGGYNL